jgi:hypothetical protein
MTTKAADPFSVILRRKKIPMGLLVDSEKVGRPQSRRCGAVGEKVDVSVGQFSSVPLRGA